MFYGFERTLSFCKFTMKSYCLSLPLIIESVDQQHNETLLELINSLQPNSFGNITQTDWGTSGNRLYQELFSYMVYPLLDEMGYSIYEKGKTEISFKITRPWCQRYSKNSYHEWHDHGAGLSFIYYVELPDGTPGTMFKDPVTKEIHQPKVKQGDLIMFPSFVSNCSPPNQSDQIKTIVSFNMISSL